MRFFRRKFTRRRQVTLTDQIAIYLNSRQRKLADYLNDKCKGISVARTRLVLIVFCILAAGYLTYLILGAFN